MGPTSSFDDYTETEKDRAAVLGRHPDTAKIRVALPTMTREELEAVAALLCAYIENEAP
jgi:hypothetical protein